MTKLFLTRPWRLVQPLGLIRSYPHVPEDEDRRRAAREVAEKRQKKKEEKEQK
jgi:hypothetical protein